jgi:uncharacterized protein YjbI with pentapeptide repeats
MAKCSYKLDFFGHSCKHTAMKKADDDGIKRCIFHSRREKKDVEEFYQGFKILYKTKQHSFQGFIFPKSFDFIRMRKEIGRLKFVDAFFFETIFFCDVDFSEAEFTCEDGTWFTRVMFLGNGVTDFSEANFSGKGMIDFSNVKFISGGGTNFSKAKFRGEGGTSFAWSEFSGEWGTNFSEVQFSDKGGTYFAATKFLGVGKTDFSRAQFSGKGRTNFSWAKFSSEGGTLFSFAKFSGAGGTSFLLTKFSSEGGNIFGKTQFSSEGGTDFSLAQFTGKGGTNFRDAEFSGEGEVKFTGRTFYEGTEADFRVITFKNPESITFDGVELSKVRFLKTDLSKINFTKVYWTGRKYDSSTYKGRIRVYDEEFQYRGRFLRKFEDEENKEDGKIKAFFRKTGFKFVSWLNKLKPKEKNDNHYEVQRLYNQLLENYVKTNRYHEAGDFFAGTMEMRRREKFEKRRIRIALWFYRLFSLYGERPFWAVGWLLFTFFSYGVLYSFFDLAIIENSLDANIEADMKAKSKFVKGLMISLSNLTLGRTSPIFEVVNPICGNILQATEIVAGAVLVSLFILAMNRKFRRTKD